jgi:uncharacterized FlaG/YvyC family protein
MSENMITPISSIRPTDAGTQPKVSGIVPLETSVAQKSGTPEQDKVPAQNENESAPENQLSNVSIYFRVNAENQELTVFVVDRASKRVLRSIPASEFYKLQAGDLLKLTA